MASSEEPGERIRDLDIGLELRQSYLRYAMSVIVDRALPDVRDGLKPSQRRILVAMNDLNLTPARKTLKCAKVVGETMGNYHPHGDQAIYPTLVRMGQDFNMSVRLVEPQGNFGSVDGDPPASMRYTECRMTAAAMELLEDLDKETVDFRPNYDDSRLEPTVLPGHFPNLLINGGAGIAVAMASSLPPHHPREVANAVIAYLDDPEVSVYGLMEHLPGPDFPTGGRICGKNAILEAYATGRGILEVRARAEVVDGPRGADIVVTEIPYQMNRSTLVKRIAELAKSDRLTGIADVRDESSAATRVVIRVKRGEDPEIVLNQLYRYGGLRDSFSVIMIALVDGRPVLCSLKRLIEEFVRHRKDVITRRTRFLLRKAEERDHVVAGLLKALDLIDEIVALLRASADPKDAKAALMERFAFTPVQADAILQMRLQRLTGLQRRELEEEHEELRARIAEYQRILSDERNVVALVRADMEALRERHPFPRRTAIEEAAGEFATLDLIPPENVVVTLSHAGYVKRTGLEAYRTQRRGGKGIKGTDDLGEDFVEHLIVANTHDWVLYFTDRGRVFKDQAYGLPDMGRYAKGRAMVNYLDLAKDERVNAVLPLRDLDDERAILFVTRRGVVKRTPLSEFGNIRRTGIIAIQLREGDSLEGVKLVDAQDEVVLVTAQGQAIRFPVSEVRAMGRTASGVRGIALKGEDLVVGAAVAEPAAALLTICERGYGKRTLFEEYPTKHRGGYGVRNLSLSGLERNGPVVAARAVEDGDEVILITEGGQSIRMQVTPEQFRTMGRSTGGVKVIEVPEGDRLVSMAWVRPEEGEKGGNGGNGVRRDEPPPKPGPGEAGTSR
jgi:DNA gyrase subunit A